MQCEMVPFFYSFYQRNKWPKNFQYFLTWFLIKVKFKNLPKIVYILQERVKMIVITAVKIMIVIGKIQMAKLKATISKVPKTF